MSLLLMFLMLKELLSHHIKNHSIISFLQAQVMIISCAFQKNWDFSGRFPMKTFLSLHVLGPNMLKWFCPTAVSHLKDGMSYAPNCA
ncbi:hypothetical protein NC651_019559 [Populus alba x Populus x berolinensis]|nr:hypothetical protein NC651_019559 [Populus alba x Populus x berolinensis]